MNLMSPLQPWKTSLEWLLHNSTVRQGGGPKIKRPQRSIERGAQIQVSPDLRPSPPCLPLPLGPGLTVLTWTARQ